MAKQINGTLLTKILTDDQYVIILGSCSLMCSVLSFLGLMSNIINIITFISLGLKDGVTVSFLFLSLFDLSFLIMSFCYGISIGLNAIEIHYSVIFDLEPLGLFVFFGNIMVFLNVINTLTTTFLAVARCMCVARPLHFKNTFTRSRTIVINLGFLIFAASTYMPILVNMGMANSNMTRPTLWVSKKRKVIQITVWFVINTLFVFTEVIIIVCICVMANSLRTASRFRQASGTHVASQQAHTGQAEKTLSSTNNKLAGKDLRVVQQVILISLVYIICNTPKILILVATATEPRYTLNGLYSNLYLGVHSLQKLFEVANASVNTFIYYSYNTKFKTKLRELANISADEMGSF